MKKILPLAIAVLSAPILLAQIDTKELLSEGQRAYLAGDYATAKARFSLVLEADPRNAVANNYMRMVIAAQAKNPESKLSTDLKGLVLPNVELKEASFSSALEYLRQQASKQKVNVSMVLKVPKEKTESVSVTVSLRNIPFLEALRYVCDLADAKYVVETYAVVIKDQSAAPTATSATPEPAAPTADAR